MNFWTRLIPVIWLLCVAGLTREFWTRLIVVTWLVVICLCNVFSGQGPVKLAICLCCVVAVVFMNADCVSIKGVGVSIKRT
jgi:hypothetical protein